jgi:hypothetical protein
LIQWKVCCCMLLRGGRTFNRFSEIYRHTFGQARTHTRESRRASGICSKFHMCGWAWQLVLHINVTQFYSSG